MRACMVAYTFYEGDNRVLRYAETLAKRGDQVDVISLWSDGQAAQECVNGVQIYRVQGRVRDEKSQWTYFFRVLLFFVRAMLMVTRQHWIRPYSLVHVHSIPDFLVFVAWLPRLAGCPIILDVHDLLPELYANKFSGGERSLHYRFLLLEERWSAGFAQHLIIANHLWARRITQRSVPAEKCTVVTNAPDPTIFYPGPRDRSDNKFIMLFPGSLNRHQGVDVAVRAVQLVRDRVPSLQFHIYGQGPEQEFLKHLVAELGLQERVFIKSPLPLREMAKLMRSADLGVVPKRNDFFGGEAFSTKILEFMATGIPVVVSETKIDRHYFNDDQVAFFPSGDEKALADRIVELAEDCGRRERLARHGAAFVQHHNWDTVGHIYLDLVNSLTGHPVKTGVGSAVAL